MYICKSKKLFFFKQIKILSAFYFCSIDIHNSKHNKLASQTKEHNVIEISFKKQDLLLASMNSFALILKTELLFYKLTRRKNAKWASKHSGGSYKILNHMLLST